MRPLIPVLAGAGLLVGGFAQVGHATRVDLDQHHRYVINLSNVECPTPPGMNRDDFMSEVQYVGNLPTKLNLLDADLATEIAAAFAKHPSVGEVQRVEVQPLGRVLVKLRFRAKSLGRERVEVTLTSDPLTA